MSPPEPPKYKPASRFVLRSPLLPFQTIVDWGTDDATARARLRQILEDPAVREAVFVASPELDGQLAGWAREPETPSSQGVERALVRYVSRAAGRSTPFGLFSGVAAGPIGGTTRLELPARSTYSRHTRLDNDYLFALCNDLAADPAIRAVLTYRPNTSLYQAGGRLRYAEARVTGGARSYHLVAVDPSDYLLAVLDRARAGATLAELAAVLQQDPEVTEEEAHGFLEELVQTQLLVPDLQPPVTGPEPTGKVIEQLRRLEPGAAAADALAAAERAIEEHDKTPPGAEPDTYRAVANGLSAALPTKVDIKRMFQVDLFKPAPAAQLGTRLADDLGRAVDLLRRLAPPSDDDLFQRFRQAFSARYETREVPLLEALDEEVGVGFNDGDTAAGGAPLLADIMFPPRPETRRVATSRRDNYLLGLVAEATRTSAHEIVLSDKDIEKLSRPTPVQLADTVSISAILVAESPEALEQGKYLVRIHGVDSGPGVRLLGRFCHGSREVEELTREVVAAEHALRPDVAFAEIVHLPEGRIGNILLRPVLRPYEIVYLGASGAEPDHQLPVSDLLVSVIGDRVILRSRRLRREVLPRMTTAHNYSARSLGVYRFLCSLGQQQGRGAVWSWGLANDLPFLPRVRRGKLVLSRARWLLTEADLEPLEAASKGSNAAKTPEQIRALRQRQAAAARALRERRGLPRWIVVADGDNELPVDLDNPLMVDSFVHLVKGRTTASITELYPGPDELCVQGPEGRFVHEIVVPFIRVADEKAAAARPPRPRLADVAPVPRRFVPGSPWLFFKVYTGTATADVLLREAIAPLVRDVLAEGLADRWFFIRYSDPDTHLRLRFAGEPQRLLAEVLPRVHAALQPLVDAGLLWRVVVDTYEREIERYGGPAGIEPSERLFAADSDAVLAIVEASGGDAGAEAAWRLALRGLDRLLDDLGLDAAEKRATMTRARDEFGSEFGMDTAFQRRLGEKFRKHKAEIEDVLGAPDDAPDHPYGPGFAAFAARSQAIQPIAAELRALIEAGRLTHSLPELARSFMHMHVNRLLPAAQRSQEMVLYDLLRRHYDGVAARARQAEKAPK